MLLLIHSYAKKCAYEEKTLAKLRMTKSQGEIER